MTRNPEIAALREHFRQSRELLLSAFTTLTASMVIMLRDAQSDPDIRPLFAKEVLLKRGLTLQTKFVNYMVDGLDLGKENEPILAPYRKHMAAALSVIQPTPEDTKETILAQIEGHGGIESYLKEHMQRRLTEAARSRV
jgi:hypothetical protein